MKLIDLRCLALISLLAACGSGDDDGGSDTSDDQTPPTSGRTEMEAWLSAGSYKGWACEPAVHAAREPSPHGFNRICSNGLIAGAASGTAAWPKGAAAVKELYASMDGAAPVGYAVYLKTETDSAAGANWYWYERVPVDAESPPHDSNGIAADGNGDKGAALSVCVACHKAAGSDAGHTPSVGGRDQVYTPVK